MSNAKQDRPNGTDGAEASVADSAPAKPSLVELGMKFAEALRAKGDRSKGLPADKAFIDSLYEDEKDDGNFALTDIESA